MGMVVCVSLTQATRACEPPGPCYEWDEENQRWVAIGCVATPCTDDCDQCNTSTCGCEPKCGDPEAAFTISGFADAERHLVRFNESLTFDASASEDSDEGTSLSYQWDFGDGTTGSGQICTHAYSQSGNFSVTLTVTDSDSTDCSSDCPNHISDPASESLTCIKVESVTYSGGAKVWIGTEVSWQVATDPGGYYDMVSVSGIGSYDSATGTVTYNCPSSSASSTSKFMNVTAACGNSVSASDGPVVYHLLSATCTPDVVCQDEDSRLVCTISPEDSAGPVPEFTGANIDAAGFIDVDKDGAQLEPGHYNYTAAGDVELEDALVVMTFASGEWTVVSVPTLSFPDAPESDYDKIVLIGDAFFAYQEHQVGTLCSHPDVVWTGWALVQSACGPGTEVEETFEYSYGLTGGFAKYGIVLSFGMTGTFSETISLPGDEKRRFRVGLHVPRWDVKDHRGVWQMRHWDTYLECWGPWIDSEPPAEPIHELYVNLAGGAFEKHGACCATLP